MNFIARAFTGCTIMIHDSLGLMISGFARAGAALKNTRYIDLATDAAKFVERHLFDTDKNVLLRSCYRGENDTITQT